ncbi:UNVERIFIED_ORG: RimJ/RimL family protein N-acetyltransferase [Peribacillus simplex]
MTEAAQSILQFAFEEKKLHKVFARYFPSNLASGKVMEMKKEGILNEHVIKDSKYVDLVYYGIINEKDK